MMHGTPSKSRARSIQDWRARLDRPERVSRALQDRLADAKHPVSWVERAHAGTLEPKELIR